MAIRQIFDRIPIHQGINREFEGAIIYSTDTGLVLQQTVDGSYMLKGHVLINMYKEHVGPLGDLTIPVNVKIPGLDRELAAQITYRVDVKRVNNNIHGELVLLRPLSGPKS